LQIHKAGFLLTTKILLNSIKHFCINLCGGAGMSQVFKVAVLPGDGIGPSNGRGAPVLDAVEKKYDVKFERTHANVGGAGIDLEGKALPETTVNIFKTADAILFVPWAAPSGRAFPGRAARAGGASSSQKDFRLYANLGPPSFFRTDGASSLKEEVIAGGFNVLVIRELTGGIYFAQPKGIDGEGRDRVASTQCATASRRSKESPTWHSGGPQAGQEGLLHRQGQRPLLVSPLREVVTAIARNTRMWSSPTCTWTTLPCSWSAGPSSST